jgi:hypothetical protein
MRLVIVVPLACSSIASTIPCFEVGFWLALFEAGFTTPAFCGFADLAIVLVLDEPRRDLGVSDFSADRFDVDFRGFGLWVPFVSPLSGNIRAAIATSPPDVGGREEPGTDACPLKIGGRNFRSDGAH